jgi:hypothetical protein
MLLLPSQSKYCALANNLNGTIDRSLLLSEALSPARDAVSFNGLHPHHGPFGDCIYAIRFELAANTKP